MRILIRESLPDSLKSNALSVDALPLVPALIIGLGLLYLKP